MNAADLPGFTRSVYERDHALITPESRVFGPGPAGWCAPASATSTLHAARAAGKKGAVHDTLLAKQVLQKLTIEVCLLPADLLRSMAWETGGRECHDDRSKLTASGVCWRRANAQVAYLISPGMGGAHFTMYLADLSPNATAGAPSNGVERCVSIIESAFRMKTIVFWLEECSLLDSAPNRTADLQRH